MKNKIIFFFILITFSVNSYDLDFEKFKKLKDIEKFNILKQVVEYTEKIEKEKTKIEKENEILKQKINKVKFGISLDYLISFNFIQDFVILNQISLNFVIYYKNLTANTGLFINFNEKIYGGGLNLGIGAIF